MTQEGVSVLMTQQEQQDRLKASREYFAAGCACIHMSKILQLGPVDMADAEALEFYEQNCKCTRNYVDS